MRVVLVGRTGLDAALRLDPRIELTRVATALEAVGEVAGMAPGARTVVVVGVDVIAALRNEPPEPGLSPIVLAWLADHPRPDAPRSSGFDPRDARIIELVCGIKLADPGAVVMNMDDAAGTDGSMFDGTVRPDLSADDVRRLIHGVLPDEPAGLAGDAGPELAPVGMLPGDQAVLAALIRGADVLGPALALVRQRCADPTLTFVPGPTEHAQGTTPVSWEGTRYGVLTATRVPPDVLAMNASWLAGWLRLRDQHAQLRTAAFTDALTGVWNRRYLDLFLANAITQAHAQRHSVTLLLFDIDDFKLFNDRYGHDAGDEILRELAKLMRSVIRPTDRVCRIGGDEFAVVFHEPTGPRQPGSKPPGSVFEIAHRFQQQVLRHTFPKLAGSAPGTLTISGGLATFPWDGTTPEALLKRADDLLLAGKRQGKNALTLGPGAMREREGGV